MKIVSFFSGGGRGGGAIAAAAAIGCACCIVGVVDSAPLVRPNEKVEADKFDIDIDIDIDSALLADLDRIVGGEQSDLHEFPYYALLGDDGGCGGVLIASEWILTAAHCEDRTGEDVLIGAYQFTLNEAFGSQSRRCESFIIDPTYYGYWNPVNDFALCRLDKPVYVDDEYVTLKLNYDVTAPNTDLQFPLPGADVIAIGMGLTTVFGGTRPSFLQDVTVQVNTNDICNVAYGGNITAGMICASVDGGGKDSCQGDSGGPLVQRTFDSEDPSKSVHTHVGVVSWGYGCAFEFYPGVYARTSYGMDFIRKTICDDFDSQWSFCQPKIVCGGFTTTPTVDEFSLTIKVVTDNYPDETSWELVDMNNNEIVFISIPAQQPYFTYEVTVCIAPGSYCFLFRDSEGQEKPGTDRTLTYGGNGVLPDMEAFYSLVLNGTEVDTSRGTDFAPERTFCFTIESSVLPSLAPSTAPSSKPTAVPSSPPTIDPTMEPSTSSPSVSTSSAPSVAVTKKPRKSKSKSTKSNKKADKKAGKSPKNGKNN